LLSSGAKAPSRKRPISGVNFMRNPLDCLTRERGRETSRSLCDFAACRPCLAVYPFAPKTSDASFCSVHHTHAALVVKLTAGPSFSTSLLQLVASERILFGQAGAPMPIPSGSQSQVHLQIRVTRSAGTAAGAASPALNCGARVRMCRHKPARGGGELFVS
jgi:hypothetical protein